MKETMVRTEELTLDVRRLGINGEGIAYSHQMAVFIPGALPFERVRARVTFTGAKFARGVLLSVEKPSKERVEARCPYFGKCGGCTLEHLRYAKQLEAKRDLVVETFTRYYEGDVKIAVKACIPAENEWGYRNRTQLPCRFDGKKLVTGLYATGTNELVYVDRCLLEEKMLGDLLVDIRELLTQKAIAVYNPRTRSGSLRYLSLRAFPETGEASVTGVLFQEDAAAREALALVGKLKGVANVSVCVNDDPKSLEIIKAPVETLAGQEKIHGKLGDLSFTISPDSFFQLNTAQSLRLYREVEIASGLTGNEKVLDLYCGIGSIGLYLARKAREIRGIDMSKTNIENARSFAQENGITNARFWCGDVVNFFKTFDEEGYRPDVIIVDPPRSGLDLKAINVLQTHVVDRLIYVSCNPATLVKNLNHLRSKYDIHLVQPLDMFPQTMNVECVVCLGRR